MPTVFGMKIQKPTDLKENKDGHHERTGIKGKEGGKVVIIIFKNKVILKMFRKKAQKKKVMSV